MSLAILAVGSLGNLLYVCGSFKCFRQSSMYSCLSSITIVLPLSVFFIMMSLLFCRLRSAVHSSGVRLSRGCLYLRCFRVSLVRAMYSLRFVFDVCGKFAMRSVSLDVNSARSCCMCDLSLHLGMGMKERPFSSSAISCVDSVYEDLFVMNLLLRRVTLCL